MGKAKKYYESVFTDSGTCMIGCGHRHQNITTATACISQPGGYIVGVNRWGKFRQLNDEEEAEFRKAKFGQEETHRNSADPLLLSAHIKNT
jgi:hypothetical protein